jgi:CubicO group peptidase (beta-lactamase class C family)
MKRTLTLALFALAFGLGGCDERFDAGWIDQRFARFDQRKGPGVAVLVMQEGEVLHERGYGYASLSPLRALTPSTNFNMASVTKQFTAMAVALLAQEGKIDIEAPAARYVPELPPYASHVRVRHLLHHLGGLPEYDSICENEGPKVGNPEVLDFLKTQAGPVFPAGERFEYSNTGYAVLASVVEATSGEALSEFFSKRILRPLKMVGSGLSDGETPGIAIIPSYESGSEGFQEIPLTRCERVFGDGGLQTSLRDYARWALAIERSQLLPEEGMKELFAPAVTSTGKKVYYGYGWELERWAGKPLYTHTGGWLGFNNLVAYYPSQRLWIAIFSNDASFEADEEVEPFLRKYAR